jgi:DNA polymerase family A
MAVKRSPAVEAERARKAEEERLRLQAMLERLRPTLPVITTNVIYGGDWGNRPICIDLEWHSKKCRCGRDLALGALELVGVGNRTRVCQFWWVELAPDQQDAVRRWVEYIVAHHTTAYHSSISDIKKMRENGFNIDYGMHEQMDDTMLMDAVLNSELEHSLRDLIERHGKLPQHKDLQWFAPKEYNAADVAETDYVLEALQAQMKADPDAYRVYVTMSLAFLPQALESDECGIRTDKTQPLPLFDKYTKMVEQGQALANVAAGREVLLSSPDQVSHYLYNVALFPEHRKDSYTDEPGALTSDKDAIADLRRSLGTEWDEEDDPTLEMALHNIEMGGNAFLEAKYLYGGGAQALSHFVRPFILFDAEDRVAGVRDRIFPECRMHSQTSGRHGYVGPKDNPLRTGVPMTQLRGETELMVTPDIGFCWIGHDWSNIETWLLGALANDPLILMAKALNWDTHTVNMCDALGIPRPPKLDKRIHTCQCAACAMWRATINWLGDEDLRRTFFKRVIYRLHYRGLAANCGNIPGARALKMDVDRLIAASDSYMAKHQAIVAFWDKCDAQVEKEGLVRTFMGRPRRLTAKSPNARKREASNHGLQGGVADIYITTAVAVKARAPWARLMYGKFDSQWWQVPNERRLEFAAIYQPIVEREFNVNGLRIAFPASFKVREAAA